MLDWCPSDHNHVDSIPQTGLWRREPGHRRHMRTEETEGGRMESDHDRNRQINRSEASSFPIRLRLDSNRASSLRQAPLIPTERLLAAFRAALSVRLSFGDEVGTL